MGDNCCVLLHSCRVYLGRSEWSGGSCPWHTCSYVSLTVRLTQLQDKTVLLNRRAFHVRKYQSGRTWPFERCVVDTHLSRVGYKKQFTHSCYEGVGLHGLLWYGLLRGQRLTPRKYVLSICMASSISPVHVGFQSQTCCLFLLLRLALSNNIIGVSLVVTTRPCTHYRKPQVSACFQIRHDMSLICL